MKEGLAMRSVMPVLLGSVLVIAAWMSPARAADSGPALIRSLYTTYEQHALRNDPQAYRGYFDAALYALAHRWATARPKPGRKGYDCTFDSDPFTSVQNGSGALPITVDAPSTRGSRRLYPITVTIHFHDGKTLPAHMIVVVTGSGGAARVADVIPVIEGKSYPSDSMRTNLARFATDPECR